MILGILAHTPVWVWVVFAAILLLGLQQIQFDQLVMQQMQVAWGSHEQVPRQYSSVE